MFFKQIFEPKLAQYAYLIGCQRSGEAIIIDPMRDVQRYIDEAASENLRIVAAAETHIHADYLSGARQLAEMGVKIYASDEGGKDWQFNWLTGSSYDYQLIKNGSQFKVGNIIFEVVHTPGHTPEHLIYKVTDSGCGASTPMGILSGDYVFVGDVGRPDLLESAAGMIGDMRPSAELLGKSLQLFSEFDPSWQLWPGHGAGSACGKSLGAMPTSTVGYELAHNPALDAARDQRRFVEFILSGQPEPPLYFARMKRDNRDGPAVLKSMPQPRDIGAGEIKELSGREDIALVDTRMWDEYRTGHIPGSIHAPFNKEFNTVVGCYVEERTPIYLVIDGADVPEAVLDLIRIGLDDIAGFITPQALAEYADSGGVTAQIDEVDVAKLDARRNDPNVQILDVRRLSEVEDTGVIPGAMNIAHTRLLARKDEIPVGRDLYVNCHTGIRSNYACGFLAKQGHHVINVKGGFAAWKKDNRPTESLKATEATTSQA